MVHDLRTLMREINDRMPQPRAAVLDSRMLQSGKRRRGSKVHVAVDTLAQLLAAVATPANEQDRAQVGELAERLREATGNSVEVAFVDQGYTGLPPMLMHMACAWKWSSCRVPSVGSCCCLVAGLLSAVLPGWRASAVWLAIMNACRKPLSAYISSPSPS